MAGANGPGNIAATHSNFDTSSPEGEAKVIDGGGNQTAPPVFVNAENGDFREAAGSPTIDAGIADQLGPLDLAGNPRILGAAPDIGAYEFVPPPAVAVLPPAAPAGQLQSLSLAPSTFAPAKTGEAILSTSQKSEGADRRRPSPTRSPPRRRRSSSSNGKSPAVASGASA